MISSEAALRAAYEKARPLGKGVEYRKEKDCYCTLTVGDKGEWGPYGLAFFANEEFELWKQAAEFYSAGPAPQYTCVGKGGLYELVGESKGAGTSRDQSLMVYRNSDTGDLYHRTPADFGLRMLSLATGQTVTPPGVNLKLPLPRGTLVCPKCSYLLDFENIAGMRVIVEGTLKARCRKCKTYFDVMPNQKVD